MEQKSLKSSAGRIIMTIFLFFALFGLTFGLSIILFNKNNVDSSSYEIIPTAEIKLSIDSPTITPKLSLTPVASQAKVGEGCKIGGCNNEICMSENDEVATSTCLYQERFDCYQTAECKKQINDKCDWTQTKELILCVDEKSEMDIEGEFCGGIANVSCSEGYVCQLDKSYPDAGGKCINK